MRRLRRTGFLRDMVRESALSCSDLLYPVFIRDGRGKREAVASMPGVERLSLDLLFPIVENAARLRIPAIALFPVIDAHVKTPGGEEAFNPDGLVPRAVGELKKRFPDIGIVCDVALDPYTSHGQDGVIDASGYILNDETIAILEKQAVMQASAGVDIVAPSDMMDGRIGAIRKALDSRGLIHTAILAYSAKYASKFYGPFRDAVGSVGNLGKSDKKNYQMDPGNSDEAMREIALDLEEGADMVMVKPSPDFESTAITSALAPDWCAFAARASSALFQFPKFWTGSGTTHIVPLPASLPDRTRAASIFRPSVPSGGYHWGKAAIRFGPISSDPRGFKMVRIGKASWRTAYPSAPNRFSSQWAVLRSTAVPARCSPSAA